MIDLSVKIGGLHLRNPVMPASGTFAEELSHLLDFNALGALVTKTITTEKRSGNPMPRVCELADGMMNAIGIPSKGADSFIDKVVPFYRDYDTPLIVSISAPTAQGFADLAARLGDVPGIAGIEANISCPNLEAHGQSFGMQADSTRQVVRLMRKATALPLWVKLTPNSGEIVEIALAAEEEGADAVVVGNTLLGLSIDIEKGRARLGNFMGGISGAMIKPLMVRLTYQCAQALRIPVIGCGGISTADDALEFILAGATAVQVGTATFIHPRTMNLMVDELDVYCRRKGVSRLSSLIGSLDDAPAEPFGALP
ncbi:dihydroorotate dehydrogenase [Pseudomonas gingeri NCPPB 3146 = LMG 5327]|uniref:Dihydroorotate dehydrogenase n=2 Tax=Pseudomonas gingeri TaxID=117681 RepID=A0A7Y7Y482_9PSED|nr:MULTISPECIES: dihydroorotate dehydrogenase [Pseudomonas]NVZ27771.1 dihydroorotate dehydrogenase [Pseudomonas gingeri]NWC17597.1 dihydroorotate dehydrogenase [Pseudomonas gingeri]NWE46647.1 dihydroorotate dehydrogenase [Pseudomonas gingeri]NWE72335.1 dihydroorotate dehydrogenase [Pseudomonas gingeri]PNQ88028.1 dihydroorotate dehydrogenase [Pseudomonas gingeri NCPPB 3146 = LMG 5327]